MPRLYLLPRFGQQARSQDPNQGEQIDEHRHKIRFGSGGCRALFHKDKGNGKRKEDAPEASTQRNPRKGKKKKVQQGQRETLTTDLVTTAEKRNPRAPPRGPGMFDKMLRESCPYQW